MNNEADVDMADCKFESTSKLWRSPTELFANPKQQVVHPFVTNVGNSIGRIKEVPDVGNTYEVFLEQKH